MTRPKRTILSPENVEKIQMIHHNESAKTSVTFPLYSSFSYSVIRESLCYVIVHFHFYFFSLIRWLLVMRTRELILCSFFKHIDNQIFKYIDTHYFRKNLSFPILPAIAADRALGLHFFPIPSNKHNRLMGQSFCIKIKILRHL